MWRIGFLFLFVWSVAQCALATPISVSLHSDKSPLFLEGRDYFSYQEPVYQANPSDPILIQFFFDYDCRVCSSALDILELYSQINFDKVVLKELPIAAEKAHYSALIFYALKEIQAEDISALLLFETADKHRYGQLSRFHDLRLWLDGQGVNTDDFTKALYSVKVAKAVEQAEKLTEEYGVFTFPYVVIDGRYVLTASTLYSDDYSFAVLDFLVSKLMKEKQK
ncbi:TPA: thiol:disulfide interchange protein DsbA/DsbL [Pasteurella multocida]|uniref:thiol:disulfide interchange protein DsbA/DsbL n=1 Tax=Pasteurella multocida TaxID=747 RepID=UPI000233F861|nr:thiol:disulfide interchange protein DsbA/DsbL [Pasteurella multocida]AWW59952.1 thiol:disulfide interchange protein DsbA/DsbL [Pasteurellaceae bacterium 12591]AET16012.1 thioredoxin fold protein [Pasteurella multocida 36950]AHE64505.1 thioredoxin fold protein [Pasteurella multocida subsp. multocida str. HB03]AIN48830.1 DSBA-like thioredoxin domain protein [Pasteurella multocida]ANJ90267.1 thioredoxin fold protein [Pasteurella multocida subsp. multocida HB01]